MKKTILALLLTICTFAYAGTNSFYSQTISAGSGTITLINLSNAMNIPDFIWLYPNGGNPVSLSQNLILSSTGTASAYNVTHVQLYWEAGAINLNGYTATAFGYNVPQWLLNDNAILDFYFKGNTAILQGIPRPDIGDTSSISGSSIIPNSIPWLQQFDVVTNFNDSVNINGTLKIKSSSTGTPTVGASLIATDTFGHNIYGCVPLCVSDTPTIIPTIHTLLGYWKITGNTGTNEGINYLGTADNHSLVLATIGVPRVWIDSATGYMSLQAGANPPNALTVGAAKGFQVSGSTGNIVVLNGVTTSFPSSQGLARSTLQNDGAGNLSWAPTSDTGTTFTPVTGDSVNLVTPKNTVNPAGTIANFTLILPAVAINWQVYEFSFLQAVSALHWSIRLNGGTVSAGVPTAAAQYATIKIYYNPTLSEWVLY